VRQATGVGKAKFVAEFVRMIAENDERVTVFCWHREVYSILLEMLSDERLGDLKPTMYTGTESVKQKQEAKDRFCGGDSRVMLMSLRSGAGLDGIQHHCRVGVFAELDWSPAVIEQCEGRIARDGQPDPTLFYYLLSTGGSDPVLADLLGVKRGQIEGIRDPNGAFEHGLDAEGQNVKKLAQAYLDKRRGGQAAATARGHGR
jgi:SNF2 family DNA or RNA helicase